jgi:hypothetical protein
MKSHDFGVLHPVLPLDHQPLTLVHGDPVGFAEDDPTIFVFVHPDADIVASGIESVARGRATAAAGHSNPLNL